MPIVEAVGAMGGGVGTSQTQQEMMEAAIKQAHAEGVTDQHEIHLRIKDASDLFRLYVQDVEATSHARERATRMEELAKQAEAGDYNAAEYLASEKKEAALELERGKARAKDRETLMGAAKARAEAKKSG